MQSVLRQWIRVVRSDPKGRAEISGRKIYILPTRYGVLFGVLLLTMLIGSINYANNPAFLLTFLLTGLVIQTIYSTWYNLLGIGCKWQGTTPVFAGETARVQISLGDVQSREHWSVQLAYDDNPAVITDLPSTGLVAEVPFQTSHRGLIQPGRLTMETRYPFGLARAWSYLYIDSEILVYPAPAADCPIQDPPQYQGSQQGDRGVGTDDFVGHRGYRPGDSPKQINWKAYAADRGLQVKQFGGDRVNSQWLDIRQMQGRDLETRLAQLCRGVIDLQRQGANYGLRLGDTQIDPGNGAAHQQRCLRALALFGHDHE